MTTMNHHERCGICHSDGPCGHTESDALRALRASPTCEVCGRTNPHGGLMLACRDGEGCSDALTAPSAAPSPSPGDPAHNEK